MREEVSMKVILSKDYDKLGLLLTTTMLSQKEIAVECECSVPAVELYKAKNKLKRPDNYSIGDKINKTRSSLKGSKWEKNI